VKLSKKEPPRCPICEGEIFGALDLSHWEGHVHVIESGSAAGSYTWACNVCGPSDMCWAESFKAAAGLGVHMMERHQLPPN
jgi:hypothetical protein